MQLTIIAPAATQTVTELKWVSKGGASIDSTDGTYRLRRNSKGQWRILNQAGEVLWVAADKDAAKRFASNHVAATTDTTGVKAALESGDAHVYSVRSNGTTRRRHFLTGQDLATALQVRAARELGKGMAFIAGELHVSVSAVRRILIDLAITEELQEMQDDQLAAMLVGSTEDN